MIRTLTAARLSSGKSDDRKNKRYVTIPDTLFASLLKSLRGRDVILNDKPAHIRLEDHPVSASINSSYRLITSVKPDECVMIIGSDGFITDTEEGKLYIDRIANTPDELKLISFFIKHGDVSIKPILNEFRNTIFSRYSSFISVDQGIRNDFKLSSVRISTHFDYEGGTNAVDVYIRYLRKKIDEDFSPRLIHTVRGVGYVLKEDED